MVPTVHLALPAMTEQKLAKESDDEDTKTPTVEAPALPNAKETKNEDAPKSDSPGESSNAPKDEKTTNNLPFAQTVNISIVTKEEKKDEKRSHIKPKLRVPKRPAQLQKADISGFLQCLRCIMIAMNVFVWVAGVVMIGAGLPILFDSSLVTLQTIITVSPDDNFLSTAAIVMTATGSFLFVVGFCGCCGAVAYNNILLTCYSSFLIMVILVEMAGTGLALTTYGKMGAAELTLTLKDKISNAYDATKNDTLVVRGIDATQLQFDCCGLNDYTDWAGTNYANSTGFLVPESCCTVKDKNKLNYQNPNYRDISKCRQEALNSSGATETFLKTKGCLTIVQEWVSSNLLIVIGVVAGFTFVEVLSLVTACCLVVQVSYRITKPKQQETSPPKAKATGAKDQPAVEVTQSVTEAPTAEASLSKE